MSDVTALTLGDLITMHTGLRFHSVQPNSSKALQTKSGQIDASEIAFFTFLYHENWESKLCLIELAPIGANSGVLH